MSSNDMQRLIECLQNEMGMRKQHGDTCDLDNVARDNETEKKEQPVEIARRNSSIAMVVDKALGAFATQASHGAVYQRASMTQNMMVQAKTKLLEMKINAIQKRLAAFKRSCAKEDYLRKREFQAKKSSSKEKANDDIKSKRSGGWLKAPTQRDNSKEKSRVHPIDNSDEHKESGKHDDGDHHDPDDSHHEHSIGEIARKNPGTIIVTLVLLLIIVLIIILISTLELWLPTFGYYTPHWSYDSYGQPFYWADLTQDNSEMAMYNDINGETDYSLCAAGTHQSPINIRTGLGAGFVRITPNFGH